MKTFKANNHLRWPISLYYFIHKAHLETSCGQSGTELNPQTSTSPPLSLIWLLIGRSENQSLIHGVTTQCLIRGYSSGAFRPAHKGGLLAGPRRRQSGHAPLYPGNPPEHRGPWPPSRPGGTGWAAAGGRPLCYCTSLYQCT